MKKIFFLLVGIFFFPSISLAFSDVPETHENFEFLACETDVSSWNYNYFRDSENFFFDKRENIFTKIR